MILAKDAFNASYTNNIEVQEEWNAVQEYVNEAIKKGKFYVTIPYCLSRAICTLIRQYGYEIFVLEKSTKIRWDYISESKE